MAYATPSDMRKRYDERQLAELVSDTDGSVELVDLDADENLLTSLSDASGNVNAALLTGNRYQVSDLEGLTGDALGDLKRIVCTQAFVYLRQRRGGGYQGDLDAIERDEKQIEGRLDLLRRGINVFNLVDQKDSNPAPVQFLPSLVDSANLLRDRTQNYYPMRRPGQ